MSAYKNAQFAPPAQQGFYMPPEWLEHRATWLSWPHNAETWPGHFLQVQQVFGELATILSRFEHVEINVGTPEMEAVARKSISEAGGNFDQINFNRITTNCSWVRDHGPIFLKNGDQKALANFGFNSWGEKYPPFDLDNLVPDRIAEMKGHKKFKAPFILEGGSIDLNGTGTLLTTESCLLNPNRNPQYKLDEVEQLLRDWLGVKDIFWLGDGIVGDDTDGHVDDITRFCNDTTIVTAIEINPLDENYQPLKENRERLEGLRLADGLKPEIVELPMPLPFVVDGFRLPASYANFYIANGCVIVPTFDCNKDRQALGILQDVFPDREVIGIDGRALVVGLGAVHCLTQQEPK